MHILKYFSLGYVRMQQIFYINYYLCNPKKDIIHEKMYNKSRLIVIVKRFKSKNGSDCINATTLNIY